MDPQSRHGPAVAPWTRSRTMDPQSHHGPAVAPWTRSRTTESPALEPSERAPTPTSDPAGTPTIPAYGRDAACYDARTGRYEVYRRRVIDLLPLSDGDVVLDVGCGTGLAFERLL